MTNRLIRIALLLGGATGLVLASATPASAGSMPAHQPPGSARMRVTGYDPAVAAAHGFEIVTGSDGVQRSVPVTEEARRLVEGTAAGLTGTVEGDCGSSYLSLDYDGRNLHISTGYSVYLPSFFHTWLVQYNGGGSYGFHTYSFDGGPSGSDWSDGRVEFAPGTRSGRYGNVATSSSVVLVNGAYCQTGSPYDYS